MIRSAFLTLCNLARRYATLWAAPTIALHWDRVLYQKLHHCQQGCLQGLYPGLQAALQAIFPGILGRILSVRADYRSAPREIDTLFGGLEGLLSSVLNGISDAIFGERVKAIVAEPKPMSIYGSAAYASLTNVLMPNLSGRCRYILTPT